MIKSVDFVYATRTSVSCENVWIRILFFLYTFQSIEIFRDLLMTDRTHLPHQMTSTDTFYAAANALLDIQHSGALFKDACLSQLTLQAAPYYTQLLELVTQNQLKSMLAHHIPLYFKHFPELQERALNSQLVCFFSCSLIRIYAKMTMSK